MKIRRNVSLLAVVKNKASVCFLSFAIMFKLDYNKIGLNLKCPG